MDNPHAHWRFPTAEAIASLCSRFGLVPYEHMQDAEVELSDPGRIPEFVQAYELEPFTEDERFLLMGIILNSLEFGEIEPEAHPSWTKSMRLLERDFATNRFHVLCFADGDWRLAPTMSALLERQRMLAGGVDAA